MNLPVDALVTAAKQETVRLYCILRIEYFRHKPHRENIDIIKLPIIYTGNNNNNNNLTDIYRPLDHRRTFKHRELN